MKLRFPWISFSIYPIEIFFEGIKDFESNSTFVRCRLELFDFDPNLEEEDGFENTSLGELEDILRSLDKEEEEAVAVIETKYFQLHEIYSKYSQLKRPELVTSSPDISR